MQIPYHATWNNSWIPLNHHTQGMMALFLLSQIHHSFLTLDLCSYFCFFLESSSPTYPLVHKTGSFSSFWALPKYHFFEGCLKKNQPPSHFRYPTPCPWYCLSLSCSFIYLVFSIFFFLKLFKASTQSCIPLNSTIPSVLCTQISMCHSMWNLKC